MKQAFEKIGKRLYRRQYRVADGQWNTLYYARFVCRLKKKRRMFPLGSDLAEVQLKLKRLEVQDAEFHDFDLDRQRPKQNEIERDGRGSPFSFAEWADKYPTFDDVRRKRSLADDLRMIGLHLKPFFGACALTDIQRETLCRYVDDRSAETLIRGKDRRSVKATARGTISNELSLLRRMLRTASREGYKVVIPSFDGLIVRTERGGRALGETEQETASGLYAKWMARLQEFAIETGLSQGDILRLTDDMIDRERGIIKPQGGRQKTGVSQISPLTARAKAILDEIRAERKTGAIVANVAGLVFTRADGRPITRWMIHAQVKKALRSGMAKFKFHDTRNTAVTQWRRRNVSVDAVMRACGWNSTQMYKRYLDMNEDDVAIAFGTANQSKNGNRNGNKKERKRQVVSATS